jgi:hypothetical protein
MLITSIVTSIIGLVLLGLIIIPIVYLSELVYQWTIKMQ